MLVNNAQFVNNKLTDKLKKELKSANHLTKSIKELFRNILPFKKQSVLNRKQHEALAMLIKLSEREGCAYARYRYYSKSLDRSLSSFNKYIRKLKDLGIIEVRQLYNEPPEIYINFQSLSDLGLMKPEYLSTLFVNKSVDISIHQAAFKDIIQSLKDIPLYILKSKLHPYYLYMINKYLDLNNVIDSLRLSISTAIHIFNVSLFDHYLFKPDKLIFKEDEDMAYLEDYNEYTSQLANNRWLNNTKKAAAANPRLAQNSSHHSAAAPNYKKPYQSQSGGYGSDKTSVDSGMYQDMTGVGSRENNKVKFEESKKVAAKHIGDILKSLGVRNGQR